MREKTGLHPHSDRWCSAFCLSLWFSIGGLQLWTTLLSCPGSAPLASYREPLWGMHWLHLPAGRIPAFLNKAVTPPWSSSMAWLPRTSISPLLFRCQTHTRLENNRRSDVATSRRIDPMQRKCRAGSELRPLRTVSQDCKMSAFYRHFLLLQQRAGLRETW